MKKVFCLVATTLLSFLLHAQKQTYSFEKALSDSMLKYNIPNGKLDSTQGLVEAELEPSVDLSAWRLNLEKNLQKPLNKAAKKGIRPGQYIVLVRFLVEKDGTISEAKVLNDPGYGLAEACVKIVKDGPLWVAGEVAGEKIRSYHTQPIYFLISEQ